MPKTIGVGIVLAIVALLVNMPRFVIMFLDVDGISLGLGAEGLLLGVGGVATGIVLSGGGAYIAHTIAKPKPRPWIATWALVVCWVALLLFSVVLLAPSLVMAVQSNDMAKVLDTETEQWIWSTVAIIAVEVLAAGAMVAHAVGGVEIQPQPATARRPGVWSKLLNAAGDVAIAKLSEASQPKPATVIAQPSVTPEAQPGAETAPQPVAQPRQDRLLERLRGIENPGDINKAALGREFGVSRTQIDKDIKALVADNRLSINGVVKVHA